MSKTLLQSPFLRLLIPLLLGIAFQYNFDITCVYKFGFITGCLFFLIYFTFTGSRRYHLRWLFGVAIACLFFSGACLLTRIKLSESTWSFSSEQLHYRLKITDDPVIKPKSLMCRVAISNPDRKAILYLPLDSMALSLRAGDFISAYARFKAPKNFSSSNSFNYAAYLRKQGYAAIAYVSKDKWKKEQADPHFFPDIKSKALECRRFLLSELNRFVTDEKSYATAAALLLGYKDALDKDLLTSFSSTGASHVLSVSGLHTGILYSILYFIFGFLRFIPYMERGRPCIILPIMWMFAFLTGLSPSVVRATAMLSFIGFGEVIGRKSFTLNTVGASAFFMLIYNPMYLFDVSFQLSYAAVIAIVVLNPLIKKRYNPNLRIIKYCWELISVSIAAQLGTTPLTLYYFHQFPVVFLITNLFVIPLTGILLVLLSCSLLLHVIVAVPSYLFIPLNVLLEVFVSGVEVIEKIPYSAITGINIDEFGVISIYSTFLLAGTFLSSKKAVCIYLLLLAALQVIYYL